MTSSLPPPTAFCSYCGYPPRGAWWGSMHRVCPRCESGILLLAPSGAAPSIFDLFVIVDEPLSVRAVSRSAEIVLATEQPAATGTPLTELLIPEEPIELARAVAMAIRRSISQSPDLEVRTVAPPVVSFGAMINPCGPPRAALLILTPISASEPDAVQVNQEAGGLDGANPPSPARKHRPARPRRRRP